MTPEQIDALGPALSEFLNGFRGCVVNRQTFPHFATYCRGLLSDLPRKSIEPIALAGGAAVRTVQLFLAHSDWNHAGMRDLIQQRVARDHAPGPDDDLGSIGVIDETGVAKKGTKTPGVQRMWCGSVGKTENCIVTVHLAYVCGRFKTLIDSDLFLPRAWSADRERCREAGIPDELVYRPKSEIALEQVRRAMANGVRLDWLTFDEWYGSKPELLRQLDELGRTYVGEVPANLRCFAAPPRGRPGRVAGNRADNLVAYSPLFLDQEWRPMSLRRETLAPQVWMVKAAQVFLSRRRRPTERTYWLMVARQPETGELKYFVSNAPPEAALDRLLRVGFARWNVEHVFRVAKSELGFSHFEGRNYKSLMRHMTLCMLTMLFAAEQTDRLRGEKSGAHAGADGPCRQHRVPALAGAPQPGTPTPPALAHHPLPPAPQRGGENLSTTQAAAATVAL